MYLGGTFLDTFIQIVFRNNSMIVFYQSIADELTQYKNRHTCSVGHINLSTFDSKEIKLKQKRTNLYSGNCSIYSVVVAKKMITCLVKMRNNEY